MSKLTLLLLGSILLLNSCGGKKEVEIKIVGPPKEIILNIISEINGEFGAFCKAKDEKIKFDFTKNADDFRAGLEYKVLIKISFFATTFLRQGSGYNSYGPNLELEC